MDDRLKKFTVLVEVGSFTAAAKALHISQPALTLAINKLERQLKTSLLVRDRRRLELTDAGQIVYAAAAEHRTTDENLRTKLTELADRRPNVTVGMIDSVAAALNGAAEPLDRLEDVADVSIIVNNSRYLRAAVENREIDLAFAVHDDASHPNLDIGPIGAEPFVLVCRPDRLQDFQTALDSKQLPDFISYDRYSTTYGHLLRGLSKLGVTIRTSLYSTNPDIMLHTVLRGRGVAALPYLLTKELLESGKLAALTKGRNIMTIDCPLDVVKLRGKLLPQALEDFADQAKTTLKLASV
jgi:LysR family transcriptional regulator, transcriptional activator of the cysJI operon